MLQITCSLLIDLSKAMQLKEKLINIVVMFCIFWWADCKAHGKLPNLWVITHEKWFQNGNVPQSWYEDYRVKHNFPLSWLLRYEAGICGMSTTKINKSCALQGTEHVTNKISKIIKITRNINVKMYCPNVQI